MLAVIVNSLIGVPAVFFNPFQVTEPLNHYRSFGETQKFKIRATLRIFTEPSKESAGPLGSAEPRLKNTLDILTHNIAIKRQF